MHHETGNMVKEKKLLKEVNASQKGLNDSVPSVVEEMSDRVSMFEYLYDTVLERDVLGRPSYMLTHILS